MKRQVETLQWEMSEKNAEISDLNDQLSIVKPAAAVDGTDEGIHILKKTGRLSFLC